MTAKLNQIIAVEKGVKSQAQSDTTNIYKLAQKPDLFNGMDKKYEPKNDDGEKMPSEKKRVQYIAREVLRAAEHSLSDLMQITARKDWTNCTAKSDIVVDGVTIIPQVPITYLLFLEKQVTDLRTLANSIPTLDPSENWKLDEASGLYKSDEIRRQKTSKEETPIVLYDATENHPAQTQMVTKDVVVGYWTEVKHSGAMPLTEKKAVVRRVEKLLRAIKEAREEANTIEEVNSPSVGEAIFNYVLPESTEEGAKE